MKESKLQLQVRGLCEIAKRQVRALEETTATIAELLDVPEGYGYYGHVSDSIYEDRPYEYLRERYEVLREATDPVHQANFPAEASK